MKYELTRKRLKEYKGFFKRTKKLCKEGHFVGNWDKFLHGITVNILSVLE